jgi:hypothetical protein
LDDRGRAAVNFIISLSFDSFLMEYDAADFIFNVKGNKIDADDLCDYFDLFQGKSVCLEATTLGFVEIYLACRALQNIGTKKITIFYVEPERYSRLQRTKLLHKRDFDLSDEFPGYRAIPGATLLLSDRYTQYGVFLLGYEERRLDRALEDYQMIKPKNCSVLFGVPAFKPGWEMDAFANNIRVIRDKNIRGGVLYCGAENPAAVVDLLDEIYCGLKTNQRLFVAPIGTKPNGIGAALFASEHPQVGVLYDHPKRKQGRSKKVSKWHIYEVEFGFTCV